MSARRDAAQILAMVAWAEQKLKAIKKRAVAEIDVRFVDESLHGHADIDGTPVVVSKSTRVQNRPQLKTVDPVRFAEWVQERWPTEIVPAVNPAFADQLLARMVDTPGGVLMDDAGEVCMWVEVGQQEPYTRTTLTKDAEAALAPLLSTKSIPDLLKAIEETDAPTELDEAS